MEDIMPLWSGYTSSLGTNRTTTLNCTIPHVGSYDRTNFDWRLDPFITFYQGSDPTCGIDFGKKDETIVSQFFFPKFDQATTTRIFITKRVTIVF